MSKIRLTVAVLVIMVLSLACASTSKAPTVRGELQAPASEAEQRSSAAPLNESPSALADCEAQVRAQHSSYLTQIALRHGVAGTLYLSFVGAAQGAFYGAIAGGGNGAGQGVWIGAAVGAGVGLVLGSIEGAGRAREARAAYERALAGCRSAALIPPAPPAIPPAEPTDPSPPTPTLPD